MNLYVSSRKKWRVLLAPAGPYPWGDLLLNQTQTKISQKMPFQKLSYYLKGKIYIQNLIKEEFVIHGPIPVSLSKKKEF